MLVFEHRHPVEGALRFTIKGAAVRIDCRWPFDRDSGEWIFIANDVSIEEYVLCLEHVVADGYGRADGINDGFIEFTRVSPNETRLEICDSASRAPTRLSWALHESAESLGVRLLDALQQP